MRFGKASHWYEEKYGKPCENKPWRQLHLGIDPHLNVRNIKAPVAKVISDGAYYKYSWRSNT